MPKTFQAVIQLRRDTEANFEKIKNSFTPANGEIVLVDTLDGLRAKVGTGTIAYAGLPFCDEQVRNQVINGYYDQGVFYTDISKTKIAKKKINTLYVDNGHSTIYYYDGEQFIKISEPIPAASGQTSGLVKLYNTLGYNVDGTMTQKAITEEFDQRFKTSVNLEDELLIFTL